MPSTDRITVDHGDDGLGDHPDQTLQIEHVETRNVILSHIAAFATFRLVSAGTERLIFVATPVVDPRQDDDPDGSIITGDGESVILTVRGVKALRRSGRLMLIFAMPSMVS